MVDKVRPNKSISAPAAPSRIPGTLKTLVQKVKAFMNRVDGISAQPATPPNTARTYTTAAAKSQKVSKAATSLKKR